MSETFGASLLLLYCLLAGLRPQSADQTCQCASGAVALPRSAHDEALGHCVAVPSHVIIVSVPDPEQGALRMAFDELVDALNASAEADGYQRVNHHFPWQPPKSRETKSGETKSDETKSDETKPSFNLSCGAVDTPKADTPKADTPKVDTPKKDDSPGWILFTRGADTLVLLLVAESPIAGIRTEEFNSALRLWECWRHGEAPRVLGPYYSGAARSLATGLAEHPSSCSPLLVTGSATGKLDELDGNELPRTVVTDTEMLGFLSAQLRERHGREPRVAVLSDSSAYGALPATGGWANYRFPLHVSQVRSAHEASNDDRDIPLQRALKLKLDDSATGDTDRLPMMSETSAFGVELSLDGTLSEIARRGFEYLIIVATDPVDLIYLARQARASCPRVRLVTLGAQLLYSHTELRLDLSGMLVATSYPLMLENQSWQYRHSFKQFSNESAQGSYNALRLLLAAGPDGQGCRPPLKELPVGLLDWTPASSSAPASGPSKWLMELAGGRLWPLAVAPSSVPILPATTATIAAAAQSVEPTEVLEIFGAIWLALAAMHVLVFVCGGQAWAWRVPIVRLFARDAKSPPSVAAQQYRACAYVLHATSGSVLYIVFSHLCLDPCLRCLLGLAWLLVVSLALIATFVWVCSARAALLQLFASSSWGEVYGNVVSVALALLTLGIASIHMQTMQDLSAELSERNSALTLVRLADPLGMSALNPLLLTAAGLYLWSLLALARAAAVDRFPANWPLSFDPRLPMATRLRDAKESPWRARILLHEAAALVVFLACALELNAELLPNFEWASFDQLVKLGLVLLAAAVIFAAVHGTVLWNALARLHRRLAASPMVNAYERIGTKMRVSFGLQLSSRVPDTNELRASLRACEALASLSPSHELSVQLDSSAKRLAELVEPEHDDPDVALPDSSRPRRGREAHEIFFDAAQKISTHVELAWHDWAKRPSVETLEKAFPTEELLPSGKYSAVPTLDILAQGPDYERRLWVRAAEDFVAVRSATLIYHVIDQIRRCFGSALLGALAFVFAVFSYPFHPPRFMAVVSGLLLCSTVLASLYVIVRMERDEILRRLARAQDQRSLLNAAFMHQVFVYGALPLLLLFARAYPAFGNTVSSFLMPIWSLLR